jgi:hypothetical protein
VTPDRSAVRIDDDPLERFDGNPEAVQALGKPCQLREGLLRDAS